MAPGIVSLVMRLLICLLVGLVLPAPGSLEAAPRLAQNTPVAAATGALQAYQDALEQIARGRWTEARALLESARGRFGESPETLTLLAYILRREGRREEAENLLAQAEARSRLGNEMLRQLRGSTALPAVEPTPRPPVAAATAAALGQPDARLSRLERSLMQMVNTERQRNRLSVLEWDEKLASVARAHAAEMRDRNYFGHESPVAGRVHPLDRYRAVFGRSPSVLAENVYRAWGTRHQLGESDVATAHRALMNSPGHRANVLYREVTRIGIGLVANGNGDIWLTQLFAR